MGPSFTCVCGCDMFDVPVVFNRETRLVGGYLTHGRCVACKAKVMMPTPIDVAPEGGLMIDQPEPAIPVTLDLTCPECGSTENTIVDADGMARVEAATCSGDQFEPWSEQ